MRPHRGLNFVNEFAKRSTDRSVKKVSVIGPKVSDLFGIDDMSWKEGLDD